MYLRHLLVVILKLNIIWKGAFKMNTAFEPRKIQQDETRKTVLNAAVRMSVTNTFVIT